MAYNPIHTNPAPIDEAFPDPINARKRACGQMVFTKYQPNVYTQPQHFPNYLSQYSPRHPIPPKANQSWSNYPRSNLKCAEFKCEQRQENNMQFSCSK